jgi:hypothetical protein
LSLPIHHQAIVAHAKTKNESSVIGGRLYVTKDFKKCTQELEGPVETVDKLMKMISEVHLCVPSFNFIFLNHYHHLHHQHHHQYIIIVINATAFTGSSPPRRPNPLEEGDPLSHVS